MLIVARPIKIILRPKIKMKTHDYLGACKKI
jgi:hypothetical protein